MTPLEILGTPERVEAATLFVIGVVLALVLGQLATRLPLAAGLERAIRRLVMAVVGAVFVAASLQALGYDLSVLLGAAGFATVALGFAAQTSASNAISGVFLLGERPFAVGDTVEVGGTRGIVLSIDFLSIKMRTFDNIYVRVPNETVMKSEIRNLSRFPVRRVDLVIRVPHDADLGLVRSILLGTADTEPLALAEPAPQIMFQGYGESGAELQLSVWATREHFLELKNALAEAVPVALLARGVQPGVPVRRTIV
ncbi:MAG: mechanosensitive ion channel family protein [Myxococcota bacterium]